MIVKSILAFGALGLISLSACAAESEDATGNEQDALSRSAKQGERCGSDVTIRKTCAAGLTCVLPVGGPISEHTAGVCKAISQKGEACGSDVAIQKECAPGLRCVFPKSGPISEHTPGKCTK